uniref:Uncharacterized protein n=1 Tax=Paramoeba aestuarina TaxID=180227 RepID=A0A7S4U7W3_9EUKA|mmetsp:Transcript_6248/g.9459  ORF Transcript_6248/g.9459 Transcript_6248/m.9459 type:complete len:202 (+) Transcript_6248:50-655(+)
MASSSSSSSQEIPAHWSKFLGLLGVSFDEVRNTTDGSIDDLLKPWVAEEKITVIERLQITSYWKDLRESPPLAPPPDDEDDLVKGIVMFFFDFFEEPTEHDQQFTSNTQSSTLHHLCCGLSAWSEMESATQPTLQPLPQAPPPSLLQVPSPMLSLNKQLDASSSTPAISDSGLTRLVVKPGSLFSLDSSLRYRRSAKSLQG